jgi:hypothetical protein
MVQVFFNLPMNMHQMPHVQVCLESYDEAYCGIIIRRTGYARDDGKSLDVHG